MLWFFSAVLAGAFAQQRKAVLVASTLANGPRPDMGPLSDEETLLLDRVQKALLFRESDPEAFRRLIGGLGHPELASPVGDPLFLVHYNHDYTEWTEAYRTMDEALDAIAEAFQGSTNKTLDPKSPDFWHDIDEAYASDSWIGLTISEIDPITLSVRTVW